MHRISQVTGLFLWLPCLIIVTYLRQDSRGVPQAVPEEGPVPQKRMIPWIEVNDPTMPLSQIDHTLPDNLGKITLRDHCLKGIGFWGRVTDTVIVTTTVNRAQRLYADLGRQKPADLRIVGGVKTYILPGARPGDEHPYDYADAAGWRRIAESAAVVARVTGNDQVVLENETALRRYHRGEDAIDYDKLRQSLAPLRKTGVTVWWYLPTILPNTRRMPDRQAQTKKLVETVFAAVPNSRFFTPYADRPEWRRDSAAVERRQQMIDVVGVDRLLEMFQVRADGYLHPRPGKKIRCLAPAEVRDQINKLPGETFIVYTGAINWVSAGRAFAELPSTMP